MKPLPIVITLCLFSAGVFAQCTTIMSGNYIRSDSEVGYNGHYISKAKLIPGVNFADDSVDFIDQPGSGGISMDCSKYAVHFYEGGGCSGAEGFGTFSKDFNYIYLPWGFSDLSGYWSKYYDVYTRDPLLTQQQSDSVENILNPVVVETKDSVVSIYPQTNPVTSTLYFTIDAYDLLPTTDIRIFNLLGKCVYQNNVAIQTGEQVGINVQNLMQGMYILEATTPKYSLYKLKFIKQ